MQRENRSAFSGATKKPSHTLSASLPVPRCRSFAYLNLAAALAEAGQKREARAAVDKAMQLQPTFTISTFRDRLVGMHETSLKSLLDSLRKAGVPE